MADRPATTDAPTTGTGSKKKLVLVATGLLVAGGAAFFLLGGEKELTPPEKLELAIKLTTPDSPPVERLRAMKLVDELEQLQYVDTEFPSAVAYLRGMSQYHDGLQYRGEEQLKRYLVAIESFEKAWPRGMPPERRMELMQAYGIALQAVGLPSQARQFLRDSWRDVPDVQPEVGMALLQNLIDSQTDSSLQEALTVGESLTARDDLDSSMKDQVALQRATILNLLGRSEEAARELDAVSSAGGGTQETALLRATALMSEARNHERLGEQRSAQARYRDAQSLLEPLRSPVVAMQIRGRAGFLYARCAEELAGPDDAESAIFLYEELIRTFAESDEWLAATVRLARLLQSRDRNEEALQAFREALRSVQRVDDFRNRWLTIEEFRSTIRTTWSDWIEAGRFEEAIQLADAMPPLISRVQALDLSSRAAELFATSVEEQWRLAPSGRKPQLLAEMHRRWAASGAAFETLAAAVRDEKRFPDVLWTSAEHYALGYEFEKALQRTEEFIKEEPPSGLARAWVHRGHLLMNLDRLDDAFGSFQFVIDNMPTDPNVFEAQYLIGRCQLEMNRIEDAERTWRTVTSREDLKPSADVWRLSRFSLARLLVHRATNDYRRSVPVEGAVRTKEQQDSRTLAFSRWREAIQHLDEYLKRYPRSPESIEARYLLAASLQHSIDEYRDQLDAAMPANARAELIRNINRLLSRAIQEYETLQHELQALRSKDQLDPLSENIYRVTFMEIPRALFQQSRYAEALDAYRSTIRVYSEHVVVLTAYIQMARCYQRLGRPDETRRQIEQARIILGRLPDEAFTSDSTGMTRQQWADWIDWSARVADGQMPPLASNNP